MAGPMRIRISIPEADISPHVLNAALETVTRVDESQIKRGILPTVTQAIKDGARWRPEPPGDEHFDHAAAIVRRGWGDCDDWAPWKAAELRATGVDPGARAEVEKSGPNRWHAKVTSSSGKKIDPSVQAHMPTRGIAGAGPAICAPMFMTGRPAWAVKPHPQGGIAARADLPWRNAKTGTNIAVTHRHEDPFKALCGAMRGAVLVGGLSGAVEPNDMAKMAFLEAMLRGINPDVIRQQLRMQGHSLVGFAPLIPMAASMLPGLTKMLPGPLKGLIPGMGPKPAPKKPKPPAPTAVMPKGGAPSRAAPGVGPSPVTSPVTSPAPSYQGAPIVPPAAGPIVIKF